MITQKLVNEMGGDISFHSQPNRGSTFWFHINLNLNPNIIIEGPSTQCLAGKRLAYVEPNSAAAQCTLDILSETPLEVVYSPTFSALPPAHYDMMLLGIAVTFREPLTMQHERLAKAVSMTDFLMLALPCHAQVNAETQARWYRRVSAETINAYAPVACPDGILSSQTKHAFACNR